MFQKSKFNIEIIDKFSYGFVGMFACLPPKYLKYVAGVFFIIQLMLIILSGAKNRNKLSLGIVLMLSFFGLGLISIFYASDFNSSWIKLDITISFLLVPLVFLFNRINANKAAYFFNGVIYGGLILMLILTFNLISTNVFGDFSVDLEYIVNRYGHHVYTTSYLVIGLLYILSIRAISIPKLFIYLYTFSTLCFIFLSNANSVLLSISFISIIYLLRRVLNSHFSKIIKYIIAIAIPLFVILLSIFILPDLSKYLDPSNFRNPDNLNIRIQIWKTAFQLIIDRPLCGYGLGGAKELLRALYYESDMIYAATHGLNAHNQYLQIILDTGLLGLFIFMSYMYTAFFTRSKNKNDMYLSIGILFVIVLFFESYLNRVAGVLIFTIVTQIIVTPDLVLDSILYKPRAFKIQTVLLVILLLVLIPISIISNKFDSKRPSTYLHSEYTNVQAFPGIIPNDLPNNTIGYKMDSSSINLTIDSTIYAHSKIYRSRVNSLDSIYSSVYCFVSPDFNGTEVRLSGREQINRPRDSYYNLREKGTWQKLEINTICNKGEALIVHTIGKSETSENNLHGSVIFTYPIVKIYD